MHVINKRSTRLSYIPLVVIEQRINYDDFYTVFCVIVRNYISVFEQFLQHILMGQAGIEPTTPTLKV